MPAPIDYSLGQVADPSQSFMTGLQQGAGISQFMQQQRQQQAAQEQQAALQRAYAETAANPNADNITRLMLLDPKSSEGIKRAWEVKNTQQQQTHASELLRFGAAIKSGRPEIAAAQLEERAAAVERQAGAPTPESQALRTQANVMREHPEFALGQIQAMLAASPAGKDAAEALAKFGAEQRAQEQAPAALRKLEGEADEAKSKATTAAVTAKYAEPAALRELELKGWNIENIKSEIGYRKEANRIAAMNAAANREGNDLKRQELRLKIQETQSKLDESVREKVSAAESAATAIDNSLNTIERIKKNKSLPDVLGSIEGRLPSVFSDEGADAIAMIETLGSQAFLAQIPSMKGQGALSNAEGEKLQSALTNLSRTQSEAQFRANLDEAARLMKKGRDNLVKRYGVPLGKPDTPAAPGARPPLDSFFK